MRVTSDNRYNRSLFVATRVKKKKNKVKDLTSKLGTRMETLQHLPPSWDADEDVPNVNWDYLRTMTPMLNSMVFSFL